MKRVLMTSVMLFALIANTHAQDRLREALVGFDYGEAVSILDSLMRESRGDTSELIGLSLQKARCLRKLYKTDHAINLLAGVLPYDQFNIEVLAELAECHTEAGNTMDAMGIWAILSDLKPENPYFKLSRAKILYHEKAYSDAVMLCKDIISRDTIPEVISMIGDSYKMMGKADSALVFYNRLLQLKPRHTSTISKVADILLSAKKYKEVIEMTSDFLAEDAKNMKILPIHGLAHYLAGNYGNALSTFHDLQLLGDDSYGVHYYIGMSYYMGDNMIQAEPELAKAYQIDSSNVSLVYQLANARSNRLYKVDAEAIRLFEKAEEMMKPDSTIMHNILGARAMAYHKSDEFEKAIEYYKRSYSYNPKNISAISSIGYCYERMKEYEKALEYYERYLKLGKPGSKGYKFVEESIEYIKQELFMEEKPED